MSATIKPAASAPTWPVPGFHARRRIPVVRQQVSGKPEVELIGSCRAPHPMPEPGEWVRVWRGHDGTVWGPIPPWRYWLVHRLEDGRPVLVIPAGKPLDPCDLPGWRASA